MRIRTLCQMHNQHLFIGGFTWYEPREASDEKMLIMQNWKWTLNKNKGIMKQHMNY